MLDLGILKLLCLRKVWKYQRVNQKLYIEEGQIDHVTEVCLNNKKKSERITIQYDNLDIG